MIVTICEVGGDAIEIDGKVAGSIGAFRQANIHSRTAELGYYLGEEYWGDTTST